MKEALDTVQEERPAKESARQGVDDEMSVLQQREHKSN